MDAIENRDELLPWIGSYPGGNDVHNVGEVTTTSVTIGNLAPKATYWIRMWVNRSGLWSYTDSSFTTGVTRGIVADPIDGATGVNPGSVTITWTTDSTAIVYYPYLGTSRGANDVFKIGEQPATSSSVTTSQLAAYTTYWIRMWVKRNGDGDTPILTLPPDWPAELSLRPQTEQLGSIRAPSPSPGPPTVRRLCIIHIWGLHRVRMTFITSANNPRLAPALLLSS